MGWDLTMRSRQALYPYSVPASNKLYSQPHSPPVTSSVSPLKRRKIRLFPNPVSSVAMVNIPNSGSDHLIIRIYNSSGKLSRLYDHVHPPTFHFNKTDLPNGLYLMQILDGTKVVDNIKFGVVD